jgi:GT2 family glycosyltransferase
MFIHIATRLLITAVVCTFSESRWHVMSMAIDSLRKQTRKPDEILVVVDHNPALAARLRAEHADIRVVESVHARGASGARNTALEVATHPIMAVLDDDAVAGPDWVEGLLSHFEDDRVVASGSASRPRWETDRPRWFAPELDWTVGCSYSGMPVHVADVRNLFAGAMAMRRDAAIAAGGFRTDMGRVGAGFAGAEETEFCLRLGAVKPDARIVYDPRIHIDHHVPDGRARWGYVWRRCYGEGVSKAIMSGHATKSGALRTEQQFLTRTLPSALWRDVRRARFGSAGALVGSVSSAAAGFTVGMAKRAAGSTPALASA